MTFHPRPAAAAPAPRSVAAVRSWIAITITVLLGGMAACATSAAARGWLRPVDGAILRPFAVSDVDRFAAGQHRGIDLAAAPGAAVRAACAGRVSFAGRVPRGGRTVSVRCGPLLATYQHLGRVTVARGQAVWPGRPIGRAGNASPVPHVHLGARVAATGEYRDPASLFAGAPAGPLGPVPTVRRAPPLPSPGARPLGPAPAPVRAPAPASLPQPRTAPAPSPVGEHRPPGGSAASPAPGPLPWPVWLGLALVALGLPLGGGLVAVRRRRGAPRRAQHRSPSSRAAV